MFNDSAMVASMVGSRVKVPRRYTVMGQGFVKTQFTEFASILKLINF
jgi:hypothetical protein